MSLLSTNPLLASNWQWFRPGASTVAGDVDSLFYFILWVSVFFFVLIVGLMALFMVWYRARPGHKEEHSPHHNNTLELLWSVIPLLLVIGIFFWGFKGYLGMRNAPDDAYEIGVVAQKWNWTFRYPGFTSPDLHVIKGEPVVLKMSSEDVLHSLYIPAFRVKMDCVPGKYTSLWFTATEVSPDPGGYELFCTEYCGQGHSSMLARVVVHENKESYDAWVRVASDVREQGDPVEVGEKLYLSRGCSGCHSNDGSAVVNGGPSFQGYFGKEVEWSTGPRDANFQTVSMDENYIRESILNPMSKIRRGYPPVMPTYQGKLNNDEIYALIQYIKSLNGAGPGEWLPREDGEGAEETSEGSSAEPADAESEEPAEEEASEAGAGEGV